MGQGALSKPVVQWWLSLNSSTQHPPFPGAATRTPAYLAPPPSPPPPSSNTATPIAAWRVGNKRDAQMITPTP